MIAIVAYIFMIIFSIVHTIMSGGIVFRFVYTYKVSKSVLEFVKNYFWSYCLTYKQIKNGCKYYPEVNDKIEKLLALALDGSTGCGYTTDWRNDGELSLRIQKLRLLDNVYDTIHFEFQNSKINGESYILTPSVFFLAEKMLKKLKTEEENEKAEKRRKAI